MGKNYRSCSAVALLLDELGTWTRRLDTTKLPQLSEDAAAGLHHLHVGRRDGGRRHPCKLIDGLYSEETPRRYRGSNPHLPPQST